MTIQNIFDRVGYILRYDLDFNYAATLGSPSDAERIALYNLAMVRVADRAILYNPAITLTLVQDDYDYDLRSASLGRKVKDVYRVRINGSYLWDASRKAFGLWSMEEITTMRPTWLEASADVPTAAWQVGSLLYVNPKPSAAAAAYTCYVEGTYYPAVKTTSDLSQECELPQELHEALCAEMADSAAGASLTEQHQFARLDRMKQQATEDIRVHRERMERMMTSWGSTGGTSPQDVMDA